MDKNQVILLLKQKFAGVRPDTLELLAGAILLNADNDSDVTSKIDKFTDEKIKDFEKDFRSKVDGDVTKAVQTAKSNLEREFDFIKKETKKDEPLKVEGQLTAETIAKIFEEQMKPLQQEILNLKGANMIKSRQTQLDSLLSDCKDENYKKSISETFNYMTAISDEDFSKWTQTITDGVKSANQNLANDNLSKQGSPIDPKHYGAKGVEQTIIEAIEKGETSNAVEGKQLIPTK
jgi:hypothetical protein